MGGRAAVVAAVVIGGCGFSSADTTPSGTPDALPPGTPDARDVMDATAIDAAVDDDAATSFCPAGYLPAATGTYRVVTSNDDWLAAQDDCASDGANTHLVVIDNAAENAAVLALASANFWIGLSDRITDAGNDPAGPWLWVTSTPHAYSGWDGGQPNGNGAEDQDCIEFVVGAGGGWADDVCEDANNHYICECDGNPSQPANY
jgi:hypothetical protein